MEKTNRWTDKQVKMLKKFYGQMELMEISHMLGKTPAVFSSCNSPSIDFGLMMISGLPLPPKDH